MTNQTLVKRYAHGLVNSLKDDEESRKVLGELNAFADLMASHKELGRALSSPIHSVRKKAEIIRAVLEGMSLDPKTKRFIRLLVDHGRLNLLADILGEAPEAWNDRQGVLSIEVSSAVPLGDGQIEKLRAEFERLEKSPVRFVYRIDPGIIGGLSLRKGHIVYDASIEGDLLKLREKIQQG